MSIQSEIDRINENVSDSYDAIEGMGGTLPETQNTNNLASSILSIPQGSVDDVTVNGTSVVTDGIAEIEIGSAGLSNSYDDLDNLPTIPSTLAELSDDTTHRIVSDTEKTTWNSKYAKPVSGIPASDLATSVQNTLADVANKANSSVLANYQPLISDLTDIRSGAGLGASAVQPSDLADVATSGDYEDLDNLPTIPSIENNVTSTSTSNGLSAYQGKLLNDRINNLQSIGRFLSLWDCTTGLPLTNPSGYPYTYHTGDYFRITKVASAGGTNYMPNGSTYTGAASTTVYTGEVGEADIWFFDGTSWNLQINHATGGIVQDVLVNNTSVMDGNIAKITMPTALSDLTADSTHRLVTDTEKSTWNNMRQVPTSSASDNGKFLRVNSSGNPVWETIPSPVGEVY